MSGFDYTEFQLHLAAARANLDLAFPIFNPGSHPRGVGGQFVQSGQSGVAVQRIQQKAGAKVDGQYGPKTKAAIEAYQRQHNLRVDGVVGRQTAAALLGQGKLDPGALTPEQQKALGTLSASRTRRTATKKAKAPNKAATTSPALAAILKEAKS